MRSLEPTPYFAGYPFQGKCFIGLEKFLFPDI